jgi:hypothetical protein
MVTKGEYRGISFESEAELWFLYWAFELQNKGIIVEISRAPSFSLTEGLDNEFVIVDKKGREVTKRQVILRPSHYTPEFRIIFPHEQIGKFIWKGEGKVAQPFIGRSMGGAIEVFIEVKPDFDRNNMTRLFKNNQKFMWETHKIFINLVKLPSFFESTFCPSLYRKTKHNHDRKIKFPCKTIEEYLR